MAGLYGVRFLRFTDKHITPERMDMVFSHPQSSPELTRREQFMCARICDVIDVSMAAERARKAAVRQAKSYYLPEYQ